MKGVPHRTGNPMVPLSLREFDVGDYGQLCEYVAVSFNHPTPQEWALISLWVDENDAEPRREDRRVHLAPYCWEFVSLRRTALSLVP